LNHLYDLFKEFTNSGPKLSSIVNDKGKARFNLSFATLTFPCFNMLYEFFYIDGIKVIPSNIFDLFNAPGGPGIISLLDLR